MIVPELLAPAGDFASVDTAIDHGADALYVGIGRFNLRAHAPNFALDDIEELIGRIRSNHKKVYFTLNTMPNDIQIKECAALLETLKKQGLLPDAFIVSDPGVIEICKEITPETALHLSTQSGSFNRYSLTFWKKLGIKRVVLPRELTLEQITELNHPFLLPTEVFIHGAMCVSISGRCLLGAYLSQRHPNRGDCSQPCRWKYTLQTASSSTGEQQKKQQCDFFENGEGSYFMNSKDLCTIDILHDIIRTGVASLKIEGRNKSVHYVGSVVKAYRVALDYIIGTSNTTYLVDPQWKKMLDSVEHRPYTTGFYTNEMNIQEIRTSKVSASSRIIGIVKAQLPSGIPVVDVKNSFSSHETIEIIPVNNRKLPYHTTIIKLTDINGNPLEKTPSNRLVVVHTNDTLHLGDMLRK